MDTVSSTLRVDRVSSLHAQVRVELLDLLGERRLRDMQALGNRTGIPRPPRRNT
jgi:hypothetical protein